MIGGIGKIAVIVVTSCPRIWRASALTVCLLAAACSESEPARSGTKPPERVDAGPGTVPDTKGDAAKPGPALPNPDGPRTFGFYDLDVNKGLAPDVESSFQPFTELTRRTDGVQVWHAPGRAEPFVGVSDEDGKGIPVGPAELYVGRALVHPGADRPAVVRWTAPVTGTFHFDVSMTRAANAARVRMLVIYEGRQMHLGVDLPHEYSTELVMQQGEAIDVAIDRLAAAVSERDVVVLDIDAHRTGDAGAPDALPPRDVQCLASGQSCGHALKGFIEPLACCGTCWKFKCGVVPGDPATCSSDPYCSPGNLCDADTSLCVHCNRPVCKTDDDCCAQTRCVDGLCGGRPLPPGSPCERPFECQSSLCVKGRCRELTGNQPCTDPSECFSGACLPLGQARETICGEGEGGSDCDVPTDCLSGICGKDGRCACIPNGVACNADPAFANACCAGKCLDGACRSLVVGEECALDSQCSSRNCMAGKCAAGGTGAPCGEPADCLSGACSGGKCECLPPGHVVPMESGHGREDCCFPDASTALFCGGPPPGATCDRSGECGSGTCEEGVCACRSDHLSGGCAHDEDCCSGRCRVVGGSTPVARCCDPVCTKSQCGFNDCGDPCPTKCGAGEVCRNSACVACTRTCTGRQCGPDGCGGTCGTCTGGAKCTSAGTCSVPTTCTCDGRTCGTDSCGQGSCGACSATQYCDASQRCVTRSSVGGTCADTSSCLTVQDWLQDANYCRAVGRGQTDVIPVLHNQCSAMWCRVCGDFDGTPGECQTWRFAAGDSLGGWATPFAWCDASGVTWACSPYIECVDGK